jgi:hypothetical protein
MRKNTEKEFWDRVNKHGPKQPHMRTCCWVWTGATFRGGYGKFQYEDKSRVASRVAWFFATGRWPDPMALHRCDFTGCVRKLHLFEGDALVNNRDSRDKGRKADVSGDKNPSRRHPERVPRGENHPDAKFTQKLIDKMRALYSTGRYTQTELSERSGISRPQLCMILNNKAWRGLPK